MKQHNPAKPLYELVQHASIQPLPGLEGAWIADDTIQSVGSFKIRGALHAMQQARGRNPEALKRGVYCASAGNAAQGVALAAAYLGVSAHIYLPEEVATTKVAAVELLGGLINHVPGTVDDALLRAQAECYEKQAYFVHPFDDPDVIAGQASLGHEIEDNGKSFDTIFVPVGGGGLLAGVCTALAERKSATKVVGVQLEGCDAFSQSVEARRPVELSSVNDLADGIAVKRAGSLTLQTVLGSPNFDSMMTVTNRELGCALSELDILTNIQAETAAGLSFAGLRRHLQRRPPGGNHLAVITGKHRDPARFQQLLTA